MPTDHRLYIASLEAGEALDDRSDAQLLSLAAKLLPAGWLAEAHRELGAGCLALVERTSIPGPDGKVLWPVATVRLTRTPYRYGQKPRTALLALYLDERGRWMILAP